MKRWEEARQQLRKVFKLDGNQQAFDRGMALVYNDEGNDYLDREDYESAASQYLRAIDLDPKDPIFVSNLAGTFGLMKRWDEARQQLHKVFELDANQQAFDSGTALTYNGEGNDYLDREQFDEAIHCYSEAIRLLPSNPRFFLNRSFAFEQAMKTAPKPSELLDQALADAESALRLATATEEVTILKDDIVEKVESLQHRRNLLA